MAFCDFGKEVKKKLVDIDRTQAWLAQAITEKTGLYMDSSRMSKIFSGLDRSQKVIAAIREILDLSDTPTS